MSRRTILRTNLWLFYPTQQALAESLEKPQPKPKGKTHGIRKRRLSR